MNITLRHTAALLTLAVIPVASAWSNGDPSITSITSPARSSVAERTVGPSRVVRVTAHGNAPVSDVEFVQGGVLVARITTEWSNSGSTRTIRRRVLTLYRDGAKARTMELPIESPTASRGGSAGGDACGAQYDAYFDAIDSYWASEAWLSSCGCFSGALAVASDWLGVGRASSRLDACLAAS